MNMLIPHQYSVYVEFLSEVYSTQAKVELDRCPLLLRLNAKPTFVPYERCLT